MYSSFSSSLLASALMWGSLSFVQPLSSGALSGWEGACAMLGDAAILLRIAIATLYSKSYSLRNSLCSASSLAYLVARMWFGSMWPHVDLRAVCLARHLGGRVGMRACCDSHGGSFEVSGGVLVGG